MYARSQLVKAILNGQDKFSIARKYLNNQRRQKKLANRKWQTKNVNPQRQKDWLIPKSKN